MNIKWLGHSAFLLEESTGTKVAIDPFSGHVVGYDMAEVEADAVTVSHSHEDHNHLSKILGEPTVLDTTGAYEIDGIHIAGIKSFHDNQRGGARGENTIFKFRIDGVEVCHLGDIGERCSIELSEIIGSVDILLIPVGGTYTIDADQAKEYVDLLMPDVVIPMHYKTKSVDIDIDKIDEFLDLFDDEQIVYIDGDNATFDRADFNHEDTKVYVFELDEQ